MVALMPVAHSAAGMVARTIEWRGNGVGGRGGYIGHLVIGGFFPSARFAELLRGHIGGVYGRLSLIKTRDAGIRQFEVGLFHRHSHQGTHTQCQLRDFGSSGPAHELMEYRVQDGRPASAVDGPADCQPTFLDVVEGVDQLRRGEYRIVEQRDGCLDTDDIVADRTDLREGVADPVPDGNWFVVQ